MESLGLKWLIGAACVSVIAASAVIVVPAVKSYSDRIDDAKWAKLAEDRIRCDSYAEEAARREKGEIHKINVPDALFAMQFKTCREAFPGVY